MRFGFVVMAVAVLTACSVERSIDQREKYWAAEIPQFLPVGSSKEDLEEFVRSRGQNLHCYQNYDTKQDQCDFADNQTMGGTSNLPMRLAVIFMLKDDRVVSHQFTTTPANADR